MEKKYIVGMFSVLVLTMFVVGLNIGSVGDNVVGDGLDYGSNVCVYKNDELIGCQENIVTTAGLNYARGALSGTATNISELALGNTTAPAVGETALAGVYTTHGLAKVAGAYNANGNGNWSIAYTWTATAGPTDVNTTALYKTGGDMFAGTTFAKTTLQVDDQLKCNYTLWVS